VGERASILIVEDELITAEVIGLSLEESGFRVTGIAKTRIEALASVAASPPTLALVDIRLAQGDDGVELARELRERFGVPSIMLSASADPGTRDRAAEAGVSGFLNKPYRAPALLAMVRQVLQELGA
jgi:CheY-like chemotaxis protein